MGAWVWYLVGGLIVAFVVLLAFWLVWSIYENRKKVIDHILVTFYTKHKTRYRVLCPVVPAGDFEVLVPPRGARYDGDYFVNGDKVTEDLYPPGAPKFLQVTVRAIDFVENRPNSVDPYHVPLEVCPQCGANLAEYQPQAILTQSSRLIQQLRTERATEMSVKQAFEHDRQLGVNVRPLSPIIVYIGLGLVLLLLIIQLVIGFQAQSGVEDLKTGLGV